MLLDSEPFLVRQSMPGMLQENKTDEEEGCAFPLQASRRLRVLINLLFVHSSVFWAQDYPRPVPFFHNLSSIFVGVLHRVCVPLGV